MDNRETAFWRAVVARAWIDARHATPSREREEARLWLTGNSRDFRFVCIMADIDPDALLERAQKTAQRDWTEPQRAA